MASRPADALLDGWFVARRDSSGLRYERAPQVDRRRALSRFMVAAGCLAVTLALAGVSAQSSESLWLLTWTLVVLFGATAALAITTGVRDLRRAAIGVHLDFDVSAGQVRGVLDGEGLVGQFSVRLTQVTLATITLEVRDAERGDGSGFVVIGTTHGRLLAPDVPSVAEARAELARLGLSR